MTTTNETENNSLAIITQNTTCSSISLNTESLITTTNDTENNRVVGNKAPFFKSKPRILQKIVRGSSEQLEDVDRLWLSNDDIDIYVNYLK